MSMFRFMVILRPPLSSMPLQFWKELLTREYEGTVTMVLSKFCTFTVMREMSITLPLAKVPGTTIQSPMRTMSLELSCMPDTNPRRVSLKMKEITAATAPRPVRSLAGDLSRRMAMMMIPPTKNTIMRVICSIPFRGAFL